MLTPRTPNRQQAATPMTPGGRREASFFFGPTFNLATVNEQSQMSRPDESDGSSSLCSPRTPKTPMDNPEKSASRKLLDYRRQLVMELLEEVGMFPTSK